MYTAEPQIVAGVCFADERFMQVRREVNSDREENMKSQWTRDTKLKTILAVIVSAQVITFSVMIFDRVIHVTL